MAYTDEQKQMALMAYASCRNNAVQAAKFCRDHYNLNISHDQILRWQRGEQIAPEIRENANEVKRTLAEKSEEVADKLLDAIVGNIVGAKLSEQATAFGIVSDKMLLFRGQANQIHENRLAPEERAMRVAEFLQKIAERKQAEEEEGKIIDGEVTEE
jgi:hypothetical protein